MSTPYNKLSELQKQFYGSISFGGSDGILVPSDTLGSNKWVGLRADSAGTIHVRKLNGFDWTIAVVAGEQLPIGIDTLYIAGTTGGIRIHGMVALEEIIEDVYT